MRTTMFLTLAAAISMSAPLAAKNNSQGQGKPATSAKAAQPEKKICKRLATTGSRMEERVCLTKEEWKQVEEEVKG